MATVQAQLVYYTSDEGLADKLTNGQFASQHSSSYSSLPLARPVLIDLVLISAFIFLLPVGGIVSKSNPYFCSYTANTRYPRNRLAPR